MSTLSIHPAMAPPDRPWWRGRRGAVLALAAVTLLAALLRFWRLGYQAYWTDESYTIGRIKSSFDYLLLRLSDQGFPPGWYVLLRAWCNAVEGLTGNGAFAFSPAVTRFLPALFGTLTVPAMYLLARAFTGRRIALAVALLAAVNPFLIYYSRDIKMYAPLLFFAVLNAACFFHWLRTQNHLLYVPLFLLSGLAMTATHSLAWTLVLLELLFLITSPRLKPLNAPVWLACVALMAILPISWYAGRNEYLAKLADRGQDISLLWITRYTDMSWSTVAGLATEQLLGFLWPVYPPSPAIESWFTLGPDFDAHLATRSWAWLATVDRVAGAALLLTLALGLIPWWRVTRRAPPPESKKSPARFAPPWWVAVWIALPTIALLLTWIPKESPWHQRIWHGITVQPIWEPRYLAIVAPALILWFAAAIGRLPTRVLRISLLTLAALFCAFVSLLTNQLTYRNAPFQRAAEIAARYADGGTWEHVAIGNPAVSFLGEVDVVSYTLALHKRPDPNERLRSSRTGGVFYRLGAVNNARDLPATPQSPTVRFLRLAAIDPDVTVVVLTDRNGDLPADHAPLTDAQVGQVLGPEWSLVDTERYAWHYEWRPYLFHTWRTRVWTRKAEPADSANP
ncbi:MAG TPA: glycosyltransferase family 39 protein [Phycisphaerae bacterium]|nr:glycosyltransferase family 39 protein [Phycisphaerae bacterium]